MRVMPATGRLATGSAVPSAWVTEFAGLNEFFSCYTDFTHLNGLSQQRTSKLELQRTDQVGKYRMCHEMSVARSVRVKERLVKNFTLAPPQLRYWSGQALMTPGAHPAHARAERTDEA